MLKLTASSELMTNHKHVDVQTSNSQMQVAQTSDGLALLFSIDEKGKFYVIKENHRSDVGWTSIDLMTKFFTSKNINSFTCKMFQVSQNLQADSLIDLIVVVIINQREQLYYANGLLNTEEFDDTISWVALDQSFTEREGAITYTQLSMNYENTLNNSGGQKIFRLKNRNMMTGFFLTPRNITNRIYQTLYQNNVVVGSFTSFEVSSYVKLVGKTSIDPNNFFGFYKLDNSMLRYRNLDRRFGVMIPETKIIFQGTPTCFATTLNDDSTTRLYVSVNIPSPNDNTQKTGSIRIYEPNQIVSQNDGGTTIITSPLLKDSTQLFADCTDTESILWIVTTNKDVFRMKCKKGSESTPSAWSTPVSLAKNAWRIAPYLNRITGKSTIFIQNNDGSLIKIKQDPETKIWQQRNVLLNPTSIQNIREYDTFTTHVQVIDENGFPQMNNFTITMDCDSQASFYINNKYFVASTESPNILSTDDLGTLTIVQETHSLSAAKFKLTIADNNFSIDVNPMQNIFVKLNSINTWDDLNQTIFDEYNVESKLIIGSISQPAKDGVLNSIKNLQTSLGKITNPSQTTRDLPTAWGLSFTGNDFVYSTGDAALGAIFGMNPRTRTPNPPNTIQIIEEDLFKFLKHSPNEVKTVGYYETALVISLADAVYSVALDTEHAIAHTFHLILQRLQVEWQKIKQYVGFVFNWKDILTTHNVLKKMYQVYSQHSLDVIDTISNTVNSQITQAQTEVTQWVNNENLKNQNDTTTSAFNNRNPKGIYTPQAQFGLHHFKNHSSYIGNISEVSIAAPDDNLLRAIQAIVDRDMANLTSLKENMYNKVISVFSTLTLTQILENVVAMLVVETLEVVRRVLIGILDLVKSKIQETIQTLDKEIDFPVLSYIYNKYTGSTFTIADVVCMVCAIPVTVVYKAVHEDTPFPKDAAITNNILHVTNFGDFQNIVNSQVTNTRDTSSYLVRDVLTATGGVAALISSMVLVYYNSKSTGNLLKELDPLPDKEAKRMAKYAAVANVFYVSPNLPGILDTLWYQRMNNGLTIISILKGFATIKFYDGKGKAAMDWIEMVMNILWFVPVIANAIDAKNDPNYYGLVPETIADSAFNLGGIITPWIPIVMDSGPTGLLFAKALYYSQNASMSVYGFGITISGFMKLKKG